MAWVLDKTHADVAFTVRHMMVSKVRGSFEEFDASVDLNEEDPSQSSLEARIGAASINTREEQRDTHLRSADFLDAENYAEIVFRSNRVVPGGDGRFEVIGDLTIRGITHEISLDGGYEGPLTDMQGKRRVGFELRGEFDREAFGLTWNMALEAGGLLVGKTVQLSIDAEVMEE